MTDIVSPAKRSEMMRGIRTKDTKPEMVVRSWLHRQGYRFRLHRKDLPGTPDIVLPVLRTVIEVRGCFWHHHEGCPLGYTPKSNIERWLAKFAENRERDQRVDAALEAAGWRVIVVWECEIRSSAFIGRLTQMLSDDKEHQII